MKTLTYEAVLSMSPEGISETFPLGAVKIPMKHGAQDRFRPAESRKESDYTLTRLLRDKRKRKEKSRYLPADSTRGVTDSIYAALGSDTQHTDSDFDGRLLEPEPERPPSEWEQANSDGAREDDARTREGKSLSAIKGERDALRVQLASYLDLGRERGVNVRSDVKVIERRLQELDRKLGIRDAA